MPWKQAWDVVVVGAGNAALCAAISARENGASVLIVEKASYEERGGNSAFTAGAMRVPLYSSEELFTLIPQLRENADQLAFTPYTKEQMVADIQRLSGGLSDPELIDIMAGNGFDTLKWLATHGVRFVSHLDRRGVAVGGITYNPRDASIRSDGQGKGLIDAEWRAIERLGVEVVYETTAFDLIVNDGAVTGVQVRNGDAERSLSARAVVLACGGFEANPQMRAQHLGPNWDLAKVRGTPHNTGLGLKMALKAGALAYGNWSGCHAIAQDVSAPAFGEDRDLNELHGKDCYYYSIIVNNEGQRFIDEGFDFRAFTYSTQGHAILRQPGCVAYEIFDSRTIDLLDHSYRIPEATHVVAETVEELATKLGLNPEALAATVAEFNGAVIEDRPVDYTIKDGRRTEGLAIDKTNWAQKVDTPPYHAFPVTAGITFTYGGVRISSLAEVLNEDLKAIPNLFAAGEMVGGLFYRNYPGSSGLVSGAVFGRIAGRGAAELARLAPSRSARESR